MSRGRRREVTTDLDGKAFLAAFDRALKEWQADSEQDLEAAGQRVRNRAMRYSPVKTGRLRSGWQVDRGRDAQGKYVDVVNTAGYAAEVEKGNRHTPPSPMIIPALAETFGLTGIGVDIISE